jgi:lambda family phage minor tail protein L
MTSTPVRRELDAAFQSALVELYELDMKPLIAGLQFKDARVYDPIRFDPDTGTQIVTPALPDERTPVISATRVPDADYPDAIDGPYAFTMPGSNTRLDALRYLRFCNERNERGEPVVFGRRKYLPYPIKVEGFGITGSGRLPRPTMTLANVTGVLTALAGTYDDLLGARLRRVRTFGKFLDSVNFKAYDALTNPDCNPEADPNSRLPDEIWVVDRKVTENRMYVQFELASMLDLEGVQVPRRKIVSNSCTWRYRSDECTYAKLPGDPGFVAYGTDDLPVPQASVMSPDEQVRHDVCGHRVASCKLRFGASAVLPFGGFPGANLHSR